MSRLVIVESPYAGDVDTNVAYARACMHDCLMRGEAPFASHLLYTQPGVLDDLVPGERSMGIQAGFAWRAVAHATVVYTDRGITKGMDLGIIDAMERGCPVVYRNLGGVWAESGAAGPLSAGFVRRLVGTLPPWGPALDALAGPATSTPEDLDALAGLVPPEAKATRDPSVVTTLGDATWQKTPGVVDSPLVVTNITVRRVLTDEELADLAAAGSLDDAAWEDLAASQGLSRVPLRVIRVPR